MAAYFSVLEPGDRIMGMNLAHGGHLTHGMALNFSGRLYEVHAYGVRQDTERIDYDAMEAQANEVRPKLIVGGRVGLPADLGLRADGRDRPRRRRLLFIDMAHIAVWSRPVSTRARSRTPTWSRRRPTRPCAARAAAWSSAATDAAGPALDAARVPGGQERRGDGSLAASVDRNVFPGIQGGPLMHVIAGKAVAFKLAAEETFREDQRRTIENAAGPGRDAGRPGRPRRVRRHGQPPDAGGRDAARRDRQGGRAPARRDRDHRQQERHPVRQAAAQHGLRDPDRDAGRRPRAGFGPDEMRAVGRIIVEAIRRRDEPADQARLAGEVREIVDRFPVPGLPAA